LADFSPTRLAATAQRLIDKYGEAVELHTFAKPAPNLVTPWKPSVDAAPTNVQKDVRMVFLPKRRENEAPLRYADGSEQRVGDLEVFIGTSALPAPDEGSVVQRNDGSRWVIKTLTPIDPNGVAIIYTAWIRK
jgi:hypothetical protein